MWGKGDDSVRKGGFNCEEKGMIRWEKGDLIVRKRGCCEKKGMIPFYILEALVVKINNYNHICEAWRKPHSNVKCNHIPNATRDNNRL